LAGKSVKQELVQLASSLSVDVIHFFDARPIGGQPRGDRLRVGVDVEEPPAPLDSRPEVADVVEPERLTAIVNTGDDIEIYGAHVSPDPDLVSFWLADLIDARGWGLHEDTFMVMDALKRLGVEVWFNLGDRDLAELVRGKARQSAIKGSDRSAGGAGARHAQRRKRRSS